MKIKKKSQSVGILGKILNIISNSDKDTYSCDYINNCISYSTDETFTGKYWIDDKPIYRKVVILHDYGTLANNKIVSVEINNIDTLTDEIFLYQYGTRPIKFPLVESNGNTLHASYDTVSKQVIFSGAGSWMPRTLTCIFEYTKITD